MLEKVRAALRAMKQSEAIDGEVTDIIAACRLDMIQSGVSGDKANSDTDELITRAIILYAKGHFGYLDKSQDYLQSYESLRDKLSMAGDYNGRSDQAP